MQNLISIFFPRSAYGETHPSILSIFINKLTWKRCNICR